jgi:hypothetical protein
VAAGGRVVVSSPSGRGFVLGGVSVVAVAMTIVTIYYLLHPDTTGPSLRQPTADSLSDVICWMLGAWVLAAIAWALLAREVSLEGDHVIVVGSTGRRYTIPLSGLRAVQTSPMFNEYFVWATFARGEAVSRAVFFARSPEPLGKLSAGTGGRS